MNRLDLAGRVAIVTGAAQGIGLAVARRLADSGARVRMWDRDEDMLTASAGAIGVAASADRVDVTDPAGIARGVARTLADLGRIDVLINNAGISGSNRPTREYELEEWERILRVNLTGQFLCAKAVLPHMMAGKYGRIVNIASVAGKEGNPNAAAYSVSKAGSIALTKSLAKEHAKDGIVVTCVTPAAARTAIFDQMSQEHIGYMLSKIPMNRFVEPAEIAALVTWLASEECSFSTGGVFDISGGRATY